MPKLDLCDQAEDLRRFVKLRAPAALPVRRFTTRLVAMLGGKGGVGTTTLSIQLAVELARLGKRTVLVDADLNAPDVAATCNLRPIRDAADVLERRSTLPDALQAGPGGIRVLCGRWAPERAREVSPGACARFLDDLLSLGPSARFVVLDLGSAVNDFVRLAWRRANCGILVTTTDQIAVMDAYARLKSLHASGHPHTIRAWIRRSSDDQSVVDARSRLQRACRRFLSLPLESAETVTAGPRSAGGNHVRRLAMQVEIDSQFSRECS